MWPWEFLDDFQCPNAITSLTYFTSLDPYKYLVGWWLLLFQSPWASKGSDLASATEWVNGQAHKVCPGFWPERVHKHRRDLQQFKPFLRSDDARSSGLKEDPGDYQLPLIRPTDKTIEQRAVTFLCQDWNSEKTELRSKPRASACEPSNFITRGCLPVSVEWHFVEWRDRFYAYLQKNGGGWLKTQNSTHNRLRGYEEMD